jgi:gliding motility-associated lipoprotein GldD
MKNSLISISLIVLIACGGEFTPKQKGYNRIDLPEQTYKELPDTLPYTFSISNSAEVSPHNSPYATPDWIDIRYPEFNAEIQITYIPITKESMFGSLIDDAHKLTAKHQIKASSIDRVQLNSPEGQAVTIFELEGEVPSQIQFYVTDSTDNFLRGALYFRTSTKNDSLAPVIEFIKRDVIVLVNTLEWKD